MVLADMDLSGIEPLINLCFTISLFGFKTAIFTSLPTFPFSIF